MCTAYWFSIFNISWVIHTLTSFCDSWILAVSSLVVSCFSINLLLGNSSIRLPSHEDFWYEFHEDPDFVRTVLLEVVIDQAWIALRQKNPINSWMLFYQNRLEVRASGSPIWLQQKIVLFVFQGESWFAHFLSHDLISVPETNLNLVRILVSPYLCGWKRTELATNVLHESDKFVSSLLVLPAPEWSGGDFFLTPWRRVREGVVQGECSKHTRMKHEQRGRKETEWSLMISLILLFYAPWWCGARRSMSRISSVRFFVMWFGVAPIDEIQVEPCPIMATLILWTQDESFAWDGERTVHAHFPITIWIRRFKKPTDVSPGVWNRSGSPQWCRARRRWQRTTCKSFVDSTVVISVAASPCCSIEIT